jgi:hypothetical protein
MEPLDRRVTSPIVPLPGTGDTVEAAGVRRGPERRVLDEG